MRKTMMGVAIVGVIGLLAIPGLGCGQQEVEETDVVADDAGDVAEVVTEEPAAEVKEEEKEAKKVEDAEWKSMKQDSKAAKLDNTAEESPSSPRTRRPGSSTCGRTAGRPLTISSSPWASPVAVATGSQWSGRPETRPI